MGRMIPRRAPSKIGAMNTGKIICMDGTSPAITIQKIPNITSVITHETIYFSAGVLNII